MKSIKGIVVGKLATWHMKWVKANQPKVTVEIKENIVFQMWAAGVSFAQINKWLAFRRLKPIKYFAVIEPGRTVRYWTGEPGEQARNEMKVLRKTIIMVA